MHRHQISVNPIAARCNDDLAPRCNMVPRFANKPPPPPPPRGASARLGGAHRHVELDQPDDELRERDPLQDAAPAAASLRNGRPRHQSGRAEQRTATDTRLLPALRDGEGSHPVRNGPASAPAEGAQVVAERAALAVWEATALHGPDVAGQFRCRCGQSTRAPTCSATPSKNSLTDRTMSLFLNGTVHN